MHKKLCALILAMAFSHIAYSSNCDVEAPIHLDDIHLIVSDESKAVSFFKDNFNAHEMAHPGERFDLVQFISIKWHDPTITITPTGPYKDLPADRNERWLNSSIVGAQHEDYYGAKWIALAVPSLDLARKDLTRQKIHILEEKTELPMEPKARAFKVLGPDGTEIVIIERPQKDFAGYSYSVDHVQFLVSDVEKNSQFFQAIFNATIVEQPTANTLEGKSVAIKVADANIIISEPEALGMAPDSVSPFKTDQIIRMGIDHLGFLYSDIHCAASLAATKGYNPLFPPTRYQYKGKPTVYTFTAFQMPDGFIVEMVQADGRIGPHSYYD